MAELVLYTNPVSRGRIARWALEEVGCLYCTELLEYGATMKAPEYLAINPMGKVSAIRHGDAVITETAAICAYMADAFPEAHMAPPPGDPARGDYFRWLFYVAGPLESAAACAALGFADLPANKQGFIGHGSLDETLDIIEAAVSKSPHLAGGRFSMADLYAASLIGYVMMTTGHKREALADYCRHAYDRPANHRAEEMDGPMPSA